VLVVGKGNKERFLPFSSKLYEHLQFYLRKRNELLLSENRELEEVFFSVHYHKLDPKAVYNIVNKELTSTTSVMQKSPHMLRHAFATHLLDEGADISSVQKLLGHKGLGATQIYTHVSINRLKSAHANAHPRLKKD
jgi:integrase/recombinase XerC